MQRRRSTAMTAAAASVLLVPILSGCASSSEEEVAARRATCQPTGATTHLDIPGPGQPDPERAVLRVLRGTVTAMTVAGERATAIVDSTTSGLIQVQLHRAPDGWWPDSFQSCAGGAAG